MSKTIQQKLEEKLNAGIVLFHYKKANGEIRYAAGTCNNKAIPLANHSKAGVAQSKGGVLSYYDFSKQGWRSLKESELIKIQSAIVVL